MGEGVPGARAVGGGENGGEKHGEGGSGGVGCRGEDLPEGGGVVRRVDGGQGGARAGGGGEGGAVSVVVVWR